MEKISVIVITRNEEKNLEACLRSVSFADEIIVVDADSSDSTIKIANKFTKKVFTRKWDNFADQCFDVVNGVACIFAGSEFWASDIDCIGSMPDGSPATCQVFCRREEFEGFGGRHCGV